MTNLYPTPKWLTVRFDGLLAHLSGFPATFGMCDDCGQEEYLRPDMCNTEIAGRICEGCYTFRNYAGRHMDHHTWQKEVERKRQLLLAKVKQLWNSYS